jgi:AmmeMemoRadiSam system protein B
MYSGHVAGAVYSCLEFPETFVLIGPNHTGLGAALSIMTSGKWEMPVRAFNIDEVLGKSIADKTHCLSEDAQAHLFEHSLEVQLPFIDYFSSTARIVPITVMRATIHECEEIGVAIAGAIKETKYPVVIVASTDMSHYVSDDVAQRLDSLAISHILNLDPGELYATVLREGITMCGLIPTTIMLCAAKALGSREARLVKYATSAEISGDYQHVVGYAGVIIT